MLNLNGPFRDQDIFIIALFFNSSDMGLRIKKVFRVVFVDILPLGSEYFCGSGCQHLADPTDSDPDPKHLLEPSEIGLESFKVQNH